MSADRVYAPQLRWTGSLVLIEERDHSDPTWGWRLRVETPDPEIWVSDEMITQIEHHQAVAEGLGWPPKATIREVGPHRVLTLTGENLEVIYRWTGEYDAQRNAFRFVWPD